MLRSLRIAAAVFFALLAIGFVGLWVRSNQWSDYVEWRGNCPRLAVDSTAGILGLILIDETEPIPAGMSGWYHMSRKPSPPLYFTEWGFGHQRGPGGKWQLLYLPHWFLAASSLGLSALFTFKRNWRFTVRGLLMGTTVVAVALGLAVYSLR
jgi:hypothetical protein